MKKIAVAVVGIRDLRMFDLLENGFFNSPSNVDRSS
jgi:hypothetical protein